MSRASGRLKRAAVRRKDLVRSNRATKYVLSREVNNKEIDFSAMDRIDEQIVALTQRAHQQPESDQEF